ncbi:metal-dependent phosphohydrolase [Lichenihabitans psoromatis]|uniref:metal-dependent phosphohydrolase n=1 Tax=Lichenihabitans psoromatis TaxID=2528642 RepID=UPI0010385826|nr:metal-dependent phosphohydrolase [Lichenihabitans psoromatis]
MTLHDTRPGVIDATILTASGRYFDFERPDLSDIRIEDIATGLSNICRFAGQTSAFYSVAQHCVLASHIVPAADAFAALMHDAAEAFLGDVTSPLKQLLPDYRAIETRVEAAIAVRFGLTLPWPESVKVADLRLLRTERRDLMSGAGGEWPVTQGYDCLTEEIWPMLPADAAALWTARFNEIAPLHAVRDGRS